MARWPTSERLFAAGSFNLLCSLTLEVWYTYSCQMLALIDIIYRQLRDFSKRFQ